MRKIKIALFKFLALLFSLVLELLAVLIMRKEVRQLRESICDIKKRNTYVFNGRLLLVLIIGEDHRYFYHRGVDPIAIARAFVSKFKGLRQGGSTIEQQFIRTLTGDFRYSLSRKVKELLLSVTIGRILNKNEIAFLYLSIAYFGYRMRGINEACLKINTDFVLNEEECCKLVAHLKYPAKKRCCGDQERKHSIRCSYILKNLSSKNEWLSNIYIKGFSLDNILIVSSPCETASS